MKTTPFRTAWIPPTPKRDPLWKRIAHYQVFDMKNYLHTWVWFGLVFIFLVLVVVCAEGKLRTRAIRAEMNSLAIQTAANHFRSSRVSAHCERYFSVWRCFAGSPSPASGVANKIEMVCDHTSCNIISKPAD